MSSRKELQLRDWDDLPVHSLVLNLEKVGLGILRPGTCIRILPEGTDLAEALGDDDFWYGVYLATAANEDGSIYVKIAWFYTQDHALSALGEHRTLHRKLMRQVTGLPAEELMLSDHMDVISIDCVNARASITHVDVDEGNAVYRFRKLLCFDGSKSRLVDADPIPLNNFPEEDD